MLIEIVIGGERVKYVSQFKYSEGAFTKNGGCVNEMEEIIDY